MLEFEDSTSLALLFHLNSEPWLNLQAYAASAEVPFKQVASHKTSFPLPFPVECDTVARTIRKRRSCRAFAPEPIALQTVSTLLAHAYGTFESTTLPDSNLALARPGPSAGGLYPLDLYAIVLRVDGIPDGVYHYQPLYHRLEPMGQPPSAEQTADLLLAQPFIADANLVIFLAAEFKRTLGKYGSRGYRYVLLEAGHVAQNLCLLAVEHGLASLCIGGYRDAKVNRWLGLDGKREAVLYGIAIGHAASPPTRPAAA
jgi:SagB-type dehydrogenase family enzyme